MDRRMKKSRKCLGYRRCKGSGKRNRGAGNRGGRGGAGLGKRAGHKKIKYIVEHGHRFKPVPGFVSMKQRMNFHPNAINVDQLDKLAEIFVSKNLAKKTAEGIEIDLPKLGYGKLIGKGQVNNKLIVHVPKFTESAKEKIEEAGGKILSS